MREVLLAKYALFRCENGRKISATACMLCLRRNNATVSAFGAVYMLRHMVYYSVLAFHALTCAMNALRVWEIGAEMAAVTVSAFVAQFSAAFAALSVDNCIAACDSVVSALTLSLFDKGELAKQCVEIAAESSQPLSSRILAVFLLEKCVGTLQVTAWMSLCRYLFV